MRYPIVLCGREVETQTRVVHRGWDGRVLGEVCLAGQREAEEAWERAQEALPRFGQIPSHERRRVLLRAKELLAERAREVAELIAREVAKPIKLSLAEVRRAQITLELAAELALEPWGEVLALDSIPGATKEMALVRRYPRGPVIAITPYNFPLNLPLHKIAPAIAVGAPVIFKPAPQAPLTGLFLARLLLEAGLPGWAFSVLPADNRVAEALVRADGAGVVSFTGSARVGWYLRSVAGRGKKVLLELGGNAALIVHRDGDLALAAERAAVGSFTYAGQICISTQRILVHAEAYSSFKELFLGAVKKLAVGDPMREDVDLGPVISSREADRIIAWVEDALARGAKALTPIRREGNLIHPIVLEAVPEDSPLWREEVFGPVAVLRKYATWDEAVALANDTRYGLHAGLFTRDFRLVMDAWRRLRVGGVVLNDVPTFRADAMPYGGFGFSGLGREGPRYAALEYTEPRVLVV